MSAKIRTSRGRADWLKQETSETRTGRFKEALCKNHASTRNHALQGLKSLLTPPQALTLGLIAPYPHSPPAKPFLICRPLPKREQSLAKKGRSRLKGRAVPLLEGFEADSSVLTKLDDVTAIVTGMAAVTQYTWSARTYAVRISDDRNAPDICVGDVLIIEPDREYEEGSLILALARSDEKAVVGWISGVGNTENLTCSNLSIRSIELRSCQILGVAVEHTRFPKRNLSDQVARIWPFLLPKAVRKTAPFSKARARKKS